MTKDMTFLAVQSHEIVMHLVEFTRRALRECNGFDDIWRPKEMVLEHNEHPESSKYVWVCLERDSGYLADEIRNKRFRSVCERKDETDCSVEIASVFEVLLEQHFGIQSTEVIHTVIPVEYGVVVGMMCVVGEKCESKTMNVVVSRREGLMKVNMHISVISFFTWLSRALLQMQLI